MGVPVASAPIQHDDVLTVTNNDLRVLNLASTSWCDRIHMFNESIRLYKLVSVCVACHVKLLHIIENKLEMSD